MLRCESITVDVRRPLVAADDDEDTGYGPPCAAAHSAVNANCVGVCDKSSSHQGKTRHRCSKCYDFWW